jgi:uncharacterized membrane protein YphA (DoxX/SURF4 family)
MDTTIESTAPSRAARITGYVLGILPGLALIFSGVMKIAKPAPIIEEFGRLGWPESTIIAVGILELTCAVIYLIPRTAVLGAILLTGYLGGAVATHVRMPENFAGPLIIGVLVWLSLYLRDLRVRDLIPIRK